MKRLLLLLILFPVCLFSQVRQKTIVDSIKAAAPNLQRVSSFISKYPGNKIENIQVTDSGEYVTLVVRVHVAEASIIPHLTIQPAAKINTGTITTYSAGIVNVPPPPRLVLPADSIQALQVLTLNRFKSIENRVSIVKTAAIPPMPEMLPEPEPLPLLAVTELHIRAISGGSIKAIPLPPLPAFVTFDQEIIDTLQLIAGIKFITKHHPKPTPKTVTVPVFEEVRLPVAEMHLSEEGYELLQKMEGFSSQLYSLKDGGFTIGFGFFVPYGESSKWDKGVTWEQAERIMRQKVPAYEDQVKQYINVPLTQKEFDALTMLAYNLGGFSKATSIVNDINSNADFEKLQKDWMRFIHSKAPGVMKGLINRRKDELQVRNESYYQPERKIQILKK
ncbi:MAG: glycoside hydrolase family protein [Taibaiella sp.]|nr:glycoside hydrolase family protein [Taibaiella sp.]